MKIIEAGNIFDSRAQTLVNTVNCVGVMGKGLALEFKKKYPEMFATYEQLCSEKLLDIGKLWLYKGPHRWVLNFPTKYDWRMPTKERYLELGLEKFMSSYEERGIQSIAFPLLGARNGGLSPDLSLKIMERYLIECKIPVSIYLSYRGSTSEFF
ncbi:macro domain-containing protein [Pedobacter agri]|uniref:macro domain-containing protein n=1 Tax=Pedobacter agri TaxID=454586 RepID=UPI00292FFE5F|nr:macro domain-containing protein [Pedobacter agri]